MSDYNFAGKKITQMGLGLLGRGAGDAMFLAAQGADLIVTDLKTKEELGEPAEKLEAFPNVTLVLGEHRIEDFEKRDLVIYSASIPKTSSYLVHAKEQGIPLTMSSALFAKYTPATVVGITGTRGKSTVAYLLYHILCTAERKTFLGGNIKGVSTLAHLPESSADEIAVLELDSWQLQGFGHEKISPQYAVFTSFMRDHMDYYKNDMDAYLEDKAQIFLHQKEGDVLVLEEKLVPLLQEKYGKEIHRGKVVIAQHERTLNGFSLRNSALIGEHNRRNVSCAVEAARLLGVGDAAIQKALDAFVAAPGRMEKRRDINGVAFYNDTNATTPEATAAGVSALSEVTDGKIILIAGGASKGLDVSVLCEVIEKHVDALILLPGTGTDEARDELEAATPGTVQTAETMVDAVSQAHALAVEGDAVILSPGFASFGLFKNEYDRGDQFNKAVETL